MKFKDLSKTGIACTFILLMIAQPVLAESMFRNFDGKFERKTFNSSSKQGWSKKADNRQYSNRQYNNRRQDKAERSTQRYPKNNYSSNSNKSHNNSNKYLKESKQSYRNKRVKEDNSWKQSNDYSKKNRNWIKNNKDGRDYQQRGQQYKPKYRNYQNQNYPKSVKYKKNDWSKQDNYWFNNKKQYRDRTSPVKYQDRHRPKYNIYKRKRYVYYRSPWYSTRYIAPIHTHYHSIGYRVSYLPTNYIRIFVGNDPYFYYSGTYYRSYGGSYVVVSAPIGAFVRTLPVGFIAFSLGLSTYYYVNDTYYSWDEPRQGYVVVDKPEGADDAIEDATGERLYAYPKAGQDEEQQAKDRYECHRWGVNESGVDPTQEDAAYTAQETDNYKRAMGACLEGRQYAVR